MNNTTLISKDNNGNLTVTSIVISEVFDIPHKSVLRSIDKRSGRHNLVLSNYIDKQGKTQRMYILNESQFLKLMPFIGGEKSEDGQDALVDEFIRLREQESFKNRHIDAVRSLLLLDAPSTWEKLYPDSFFIALMNLHGHEFHGNKSTPSYCANIIRRWVYEIVLPVELLHETNTCRGAAKRHQWFTRDNGRSTLLSQISKVEMVARMSQSRVDFECNCARSFLGAPLQLNLFKVA